MNAAGTSALHVEGGLFSADTLDRIAALDLSLGGLSPDDYHVEEGTRLAEAASRAWARLVPAWRAFRAELECAPVGEPQTKLTREKVLLPFFHELGYGRLPAARAQEVPDGEGTRSYAISHGWGNVPIHLLGAGVSLDERTEKVAGAARMSPHGLVQDFLNRSEPHRWGFVSNGLELRLLRDHQSLTRQAYVSVDLESLFDGERFADFARVWLLCHQSRVEGERADECWLEKWFLASREAGVRALDDLRSGVERALRALGQGFLKHPRNEPMRRELAEGTFEKSEYYRELLRLVYRLIFVFAAEDRPVDGRPALLDPAAPDEAVDRYTRFYSTRRLRNLAGEMRGGPHGDLWQSLRVVLAGLHEGCAPLALPALGSFLFGPVATRRLSGLELANADLLAAVHALAYLERGGVRHAIAWRHVAADELGSIYESLLELHPVLESGGTFDLATAAGHERKKTGSYYTPTSLVDCLLDSALEPVLDDALRGKDRAGQERALLDLKVCDPACGSGHFLVAAARRIAKRLARIRSGDEEPSPRHMQTALRDVVGRCLYGVDISDMAVELCKVALWMEALEPGKPLSFLDAHIQQGNSLLGATPALLARGIPDEAWTALEGDDKDVLKALKKRNREARKTGQLSLLPQLADAAATLAEHARAAGCLRADTLAEIRGCELRWHELVTSREYQEARFLADLWCSAFVWPATKELEDVAPTQDVFAAAARDAGAGAAALPKKTRREVTRLAGQYAFFHWHLAFPQIFTADLKPAEGDPCGWSGGFDVVLGNPPWERVKLQEKEFFASRSPDIASAENASKRKKLIAKLPEKDPELWRAWQDALRQAEGASHFARLSARFPLCGRGDVNTYSLFAELNRSLMNAGGRVGCILPSGIATDDTTKEFFASLVDSNQLYRLCHFENEDFIFPTVHHAFRFCLVTLAKGLPAHHAADLVFYARRVSDLDDLERRVTLSAADFAALNPNTKTCPTFRWRRDAEINKAIYRRLPVLWREGTKDGNPWGIRFLAMFHMSGDSELFRSREQLENDGFRLTRNVFAKAKQRYLPLYEAKMIHHYDHRFATYEGQTEAQANQGKCPELDDDAHADPHNLPLPFYWVAAAEVESHLEGKWPRSWLLGWRNIARASDLRTVLLSIMPRVAVGHSMPLLLPSHASAPQAASLLATLSSLVLDYCARNKVGGSNITFNYVRQFPVPPASVFEEPAPWQASVALADWITPRVLELTYTSWDLQPFARDLGHDGSPFRWDSARRAHLRAELEAAFFHLYGISRDDADYILSTFPVLRAREERDLGEYRTRHLILEQYDVLADAKVGDQRVLRPRTVQAEPPTHGFPEFAHVGQDLRAAGAGAWATPPGSTDDHTFIALVAVLGSVREPLEMQRIRWAVLIALRPALTHPFLPNELRQLWIRAVGPEAQPLPADITALDRFRRNADTAWASAIRKLQATGMLVIDATAGTWRGSNVPSVNLPWIEGRASVALAAALELDLLGAEQRLSEYLREVA